MSTQIESNARAEKSADLLRIVVAIGVLALIAWFDGGNGAATTATTDAAVVSLPAP